ncbi:hypothetical protein LTR08_008017 [Meristemomyces frigidus]|nr:hypothetical protein LTR08_008017 [Meristemomyces frigidus]
MDAESFLGVDAGNPAQRTYRHSRPKFHRMLLEQLAETAVKVEYDMEVMDYFEDASRGRAGVILKDGSKYEADLVVAADGLRGNSWSLVAGKPVPAKSSGKAIFRVAYPVELALADPMVAERFKLQEDGRSVLELWTGPDIQSIFWRNQHEMHWAVTHDDDGSAAESWGHKATPEEVLKYTAAVAGWPEVATRVIKATPADQLVNWRLMWRDPQPTWTSPSGRVVQLGDAAHTFLPTSGNGGTQAMEDAISLAACIAKAGCKENIPDATRVHNLLRFERVSCLQAFGVVNRAKWSAAKAANPSANKKTQGPMHLGKWILVHDPEEYACQRYDEALSHLKHDTPFQNTNTPPGLKYKPWTIDTLIAAAENGEETVLDGDWD